jgi:hypothetical protein
MPESSLTEEAAIPRPVMPSPLASQSGTSAVLTSPEFRTARALNREIYQRSPATAGRSFQQYLTTTPASSFPRKVD